MMNDNQGAAVMPLRQMLTTTLAVLLAFVMCVPSAALAAEPVDPDAEQAASQASSNDEDEAAIDDEAAAVEEVAVADEQATQTVDGSQSAATRKSAAVEDPDPDPEPEPEPAKPSLADATAKLAYSATVYTGKALKPEVAVTLDGATLVKGTDFSIKYANNKNVGTATVTLTGKGDYEGELVRAFAINPQGTTFREVLTRTKTKLHARWNVQSKQTTGYQVEYGKVKSLKSKTQTKTFAKATANDGWVKGLAAKSVYYARVRTYKTVSGKKYYSKWSRIMSVKAYNAARQAKAVPVLTYHRICKETPKRKYYRNSLAITETNFRKQMRWLKEHNYHGVSMAEFVDWYYNGAYLPKKSVLITVDDGFYETYWIARPLLKKYGHSATNFVIGSRTPKTTKAYDPSWRKSRYVGMDVIRVANSTATEPLKYESHTWGMHNKAKGERPYLQVWSQAAICKDFDKMDKAFDLMALAYPFGYSNNKAYNACGRSKNIKVAFAYKVKTPVRRSSPKYRLPRFKVSGNKSWMSVVKIVQTFK